MALLGHLNITYRLINKFPEFTSDEWSKNTDALEV